jgi:hypothetical protein
MDTQTAEDRSGTQTAAGTTEQAVVVLTPDRVDMEPGGSPVAIEATIRNPSRVVEQFTVEITGIDPSWYTQHVKSVSIFPDGSTERVPITINPPTRQDGGIVKAGRYTFRVIARARSDGAEYSAEGILDLRGRVIYRLELSPLVQTARRQGKFRLKVTNSGAADGQFALEGRDKEELCRVKFPHEAQAMAPAAKVTEVPFVVQPKKRPWVGPERRYDFAVTARPQNARGEPQTVSGQYIYKPLFRSLPIWPILKWVLIGLVALVAVVLLLSSGIFEQFSTRTQIALAQACGTLNLHRVPVISGACPSPLPAGSQQALNPDNCNFALGFRQFAEAQPKLVGHCLTDEYYDKFGNGHQQTTTGFLFWSKATNTVYFLIGDSVFRYYDRELKLLDGSGKV